jgi:hypothetical protein
MVRAARERNPSAPASDIARDIGVSRERVRQALVALGLPTRVSRTRARNPLRYAVQMPPHTVGAVCELQVCADLLQRGFHVFRSVSPHAPCDVVAIIGAQTIRVEVRAAKRGICSTHGEHDCLAAVNPDGEIIYTPSIDFLTKAS